MVGAVGIWACGEWLGSGKTSSRVREVPHVYVQYNMQCSECMESDGQSRTGDHKSIRLFLGSVASEAYGCVYLDRNEVWLYD